VSNSIPLATRTIRADVELTHPCFLVEAGLSVIELCLQLRLSLGQGGVAAVEFLDLALKFEVLLSETGLEVVQVVVLASELFQLRLVASKLVFEAVHLGLGVSLCSNTLHTAAGSSSDIGS